MSGKCTTLNKTKAEIETDDTTLADVKVLVNSIRQALRGGSYNSSLPAIAIGSTATAVSNVAFDYMINGVRYTKAAVTAGTAPGNDVIPEGLYGAVALDIDAAGTISISEASANATGYATAALALAALTAVVGNKARMGTVTASISSGTFTFGTTDLDAANTTVAYDDGICGQQFIGGAVV
jgi:hypothetical protein